MRFALILLFPLLSLAACDVSKGNGDENVNIRADENGKVSFNLPFAKGEVQVPKRAFENGQLDIDGVKMMPGGAVRGFNMDAGDKGSTVHLAFVAPNSPDHVRAYFLNEFKQKGDEASLSGNGISGRTRDGDTFRIDVQPAAQGSAGTIAIRSRD